MVEHHSNYYMMIVEHEILKHIPTPATQALVQGLQRGIIFLTNFRGGANETHSLWGAGT
jgi:hypothetical protein